MRLTEFNKQVTAKELNESAAQKFGQKLNLESFTLEQLQDARNKLRTRVHQFETNAKFGAVLEDETYSKNRLFLDVLNRAIDERADAEVQLTPMEEMVLAKVDEGIIAFEELPVELQEKAQSKAQQKFMGMVYATKKGEKAASPEVAQAAKGMSTKSAHDFAATKHKGKPEHVDESVIVEGEEEKAELIMAARDMVDRITNWMEDTANMQAEKMLQLIDSIRDEMGHDISIEFESVVKPALATIYTALEASRGQLTSGVELLTGEGEGGAMLGDEPDMGAGDEFGGDEEIGAGAPDDCARAANAVDVAGELHRPAARDAAHRRDRLRHSGRAFPGRGSGPGAAVRRTLHGCRAQQPRAGQPARGDQRTAQERDHAAARQWPLFP